jgi:thioredoxin reductase (NADPH)
MEKQAPHKDAIIVGAGPAGLSAAIFTVLDGWNTLILEGDWLGGQGAIAYTVANYPGFPPGDGALLIANMQQQVFSSPLSRSKAELKYEKAVNLDPDELVVATANNQYSGKAIILATGSAMQPLGIAGESTFIGKGVSYYAVRDAERFAGKKVLAVGGGNAAAKNALVAKSTASEVTLVHRGHSLRAHPALLRKLHKEGVTIKYDTQVKALTGRERLTNAILANIETKAEEELPADWVVICVGTVPNTELARRAGLEMTGEFVTVDEQRRTSKRGIFACGEVTPGSRHLITSTAEGSTAGMSVSEYLALEMVRRGEMFEGVRNGKYAEEYLAALGAE